MTADLREETGAYIVKFDDADVEDVLFAKTGARAAAGEYLRRKLGGGWNCHLFECVASNERELESWQAAATLYRAPKGDAEPLTWKECLGCSSPVTCTREQRCRIHPAPQPAADAEYGQDLLLLAVAIAGNPDLHAALDRVRNALAAKGRAND